MNINPLYLSGGLAFVLAFGLIIGLGVCSLLTGIFHFLFVKPKLTFLKTMQGKNGFGFAFSWNHSTEPVQWDTLSLRYFNPFGHPTQKEISCTFEPSHQDFVRDVDLGLEFGDFLNAQGFDKAIVNIRLSSTRDDFSHDIEMKGKAFKNCLLQAHQTVEEYISTATKSSKRLYQENKREFIAEPMGDIPEKKVLKIPTNPQFAPDFLGSGTAGAKEQPAQENFSVKKVWIDPGCIVCDACEGIYPEVFEVQDETCIIRDNAPLDNGLLIEEAAEACPVEVIKFQRA